MENFLQSTYKRYNEVLKPLVAEQEVRMQAFEEPLLLNLSRMFDYLSLAQNQKGKDRISSQNEIRKILDICISQSYMYIATSIKDNIKQFEKNNNKRVRERLCGGDFVGEYNKLKREIKNIDKICKKNPHNYLEHIEDYQASYNKCLNIEKLIEKVNSTETLIQGVKKSLWGIIFRLIASIGISVLVGIYSDAIWSMIKRILNA